MEREYLKVISLTKNFIYNKSNLISKILNEDINYEKLKNIKFFNKKVNNTNDFEIFLDELIESIDCLKGKIEYNGIYEVYDTNGFIDVNPITKYDNLKIKRIIGKLHVEGNKTLKKEKINNDDYLLIPIFNSYFKKTLPIGYLVLKIIDNVDLKNVYFISSYLYFVFKDLLFEFLYSNNKENYKHLYFDYLTGLPNRRYIDKKFLEYLNSGDNLYIFLFDIDNFKKINDTYGHNIGDEVLKQFAKTLLSTFRKGIDIVGRFGGEEFILLLNFNGNKQDIEKILTRLIVKFKNNLVNNNLPITTFSGGGAKVDELNIIDINEKKEILIKIADERLYKAKKYGKNKIILHDQIILGNYE